MRVRNRGSVRNTQSFSVYIFAYEVLGATTTYYPIAMKIDGITLSSDFFTQGTINTL